MIVSIMQPYFFPYIGYFQLMVNSDVFVVHDDVQYIKGGWVNRNRIRRQGQVCWITLPVRKDAHNLAINQRFYDLDRANTQQLLRRIESNYRRAPRFDQVFVLLRDIIMNDDANVASFNLNLIRSLAGFLNIKTPIVVSSEMRKDDCLTGQERVVDLCKRLQASHYVNPIGGLELYEAERFARDGIELGFLQTTLASFPTSGAVDDPYLSIIDVLMFNSDETIATMLKTYRIVSTREAIVTAKAAQPTPGMS